MPLSLDERARGRLQAWLDTTGLTQAAFAERIGRNQAWMSRYLAGIFAADLETLEKMALVFGHSLSSLLETPADPEEAELVEKYRALPPAGRELIHRLLDFSIRPRRSSPTRRPRR